MTDRETRPGTRRNRLAATIMGVSSIGGLALGAGVGAIFNYPGLGAGMGILHGAALALVIVVFLPK